MTKNPRIFGFCLTVYPQEALNPGPWTQAELPSCRLRSSPMLCAHTSNPSSMATTRARLCPLWRWGSNLGLEHRAVLFDQAIPVGLHS